MIFHTLLSFVIDNWLLVLPDPITTTNRFNPSRKRLINLSGNMRNLFLLWSIGICIVNYSIVVVGIFTSRCPIQKIQEWDVLAVTICRGQMLIWLRVLNIWEGIDIHMGVVMMCMGWGTTLVERRMVTMIGILHVISVSVGFNSLFWFWLIVISL